MSNDQTSDPTGGTPGSGPADDQPTQALPAQPSDAQPTTALPAQPPAQPAAPAAGVPQGHVPPGGYAPRPGDVPQPGYAPQPQAGYPAPVGTAPATATAPRSGPRAGWIIGGAVAGVLLLGGATAFGVSIARNDDPVIVQRADTGTDQRGSGHMNGGASGGTGSQSGGSGQTQGGTDQGGAGQGTTGDGSTGTGSGDTGSDTGTDGGTAGGSGSGWNHHVDPDDIELFGDVLEQANAAALAAAGEGVVTSAEHSDDPTHVYEIEVTRDDGAEMELYLDADFQVIASKPWHY